jgi:hypothetical protein
VEIFGLSNPDDITVYFRATEGNGGFIPLNTTYNFVTGKIIAEFSLENTDKCEFAFGYKDFETIVYAPAPKCPENEAVVNHAETQHLEWSPKGFFNYFSLQIATDPGFNSIVFEEDNLEDTYVSFACENNTSYYWRVKTFAIDYDDILESNWSEVFVFHAADAQVTVFEPASEVKWQYGLDYFIEWEDNFADDVVIELLTDTTQAVIDTTESDGAFKWSIPVDMEIGCRYRIRVSNVDQPSISGISPNYFSITDTVGNDGCYEGIAESCPIADITVYPVPVSDVIKLEYVSENYSMVNISLMDIYGRKIRDMFKGYLTSGTNYHEFSVEGLQNGIYILQVKTGPVQYSRKVLINR